MASQRATVKYQIATYSGEVTVLCDSNDENEVVIARARKRLTREAGGSLPYGSENFWIVEREDF